METICQRDKDRWRRYGARLDRKSSNGALSFSLGLGPVTAEGGGAGDAVLGWMKVSVVFW